MENLLTEERRQKIHELLEQQKRIIVKDIAKKFHTSEVTIRKDLEILEKQGLLNRVHGGAIRNHKLTPDLALNEKQQIHVKEKLRIALKAVEMIREGDVIILDSGSTTTQLARLLKKRESITVITNAINIASELAASRLNVILTGGNLREKSFSLVGPLAEKSLNSLTAEKLFLGVDGIDFDYGLTTPNIMEANINSLMMQVAAKTILVADSSKFGRKSMGVIGKLSEVDTIITDDNISSENLSKLKNMQIELKLA
ncbi:MAG: DeoR/GlpR transcriptional regulator [Calditrichaeota bacterium]|nr:DeoR/GlpR transcriptional regulator [Calditrichota bacterium]